MTHLEPPDTTVQDNAPLGDWELVSLAQAGGTAGRDAFSTLFERHVDTVYRYIRWRVENPHITEDLVSEVFLRAFRRITSINDIGKDFPAWLVTIARNAIYDHAKSAQYRLNRYVPDVPEQRAHEDPAAEIVGRFTNQLVGRNLSQCIRQLSRDQRECVGLRFYAGKSVTETAAVMGRDEGAVKALQHRAIRRLAQLLPDDAPSWLKVDAGVTS
jgi:RNA polymerase sigma-70 factor (ECF subfamily)